ncbi:uncharacterized protein LOC114310433 [Camellia sinensis]|uniref:uncharacterized protein LOC114310433 n=1 Tax=Camellia sinensis TaxID=4442 RepID=UPI001036C3BA|nr:uncharacterized protein LOC114310433 [Camellia sinensis]
MFSDVLDMFDVIVDDDRAEAFYLFDPLQSVDFAFNLHLMKSVLGITNDLSQALQRKDQDIVNVIGLVEVCKQQLQMMTDSGWSSLMDEVSSFFNKHCIDVPNMDDLYVPRGRSRCIDQEMTNSYHYFVKLFDFVIDMQLQGLNNHFNEVNIELLLCVAFLNPSDSFAAFDMTKLIVLPNYLKDFSAIELTELPIQIENFIIDMRSSVEFSNLKGINDLAWKMVETRKERIYFLVYKLLTLALILPVTIATIERAFFAPKIVKNRLRNENGNQLMNDKLVVYIEGEICSSIPNEAIMHHFQNMESL